MVKEKWWKGLSAVLLLKCLLNNYVLWAFSFSFVAENNWTKLLNQPVILSKCSFLLQNWLTCNGHFCSGSRVLWTMSFEDQICFVPCLSFSSYWLKRPENRQCFSCFNNIQQCLEDTSMCSVFINKSFQG